MKTLLNLINLDLKIIFRKKTNWILNIFIILQILCMLMQKDEAFDTIASLPYITQSLIMGFMILGFNLFKKNNDNNYKEILNIIENGFLKRNLSLLLASIIFIISNNIILILFMLLNFIGTGIGLKLLIFPIQYMILYWLMPSLTSFLLGSILSFLSNSRIMYSIIIFISFLIGPLGKDIITSLCSVIPIYEYMHIFEYFNLGQFYVYGKLDPLYGFETEKIRFILKCIPLILFSNILLAFIINKYCKNKMKFNISIATIFLFVYFIIGINFNSKDFMYKQGHSDKTCLDTYDLNYYSNKNVSKDKISIGNTIHLNAMDISLDIQKRLSASVKMHITPLKDIKNLNLSLYHDLNIKNIKFNGYELSYNRNGDILNIELPYKIKAKDDITISIEYIGNTSPYYYATNRAVLLPGYYNWLPYCESLNAMNCKNSTVTTNHLTYDYDVKYKLKINKKISTNLKKVNENIYEGFSKNGVIVIDGFYKELKENSNKTTYPILNTYLNDIKISLLSKKIHKKLDEINKELSFNFKHDIPIFFVPGIVDNCISKDTNFIFNSVVCEDYIITSLYDIDPNETYSDNIIKSDLLISLIENKICIKERDYKDMFIYFYTNWLLNEQINHYEDLKLYKEHKKSWNMITKYMQTNKTEKINKLFKVWIHSMLNNQDFNENNLSKLLEELE